MNKLKFEECKNCNDWNGNRTHCMNICSKPLIAWDEFNRLEGLKEQRKLIELPCSFEDTIYHITTCKDFGKVLDGTLWGDGGGYGTATGYYCPYELYSSCPFEECDDCKECENKLAIFEDSVEQIMMNGYEEPSVMFEYSGWAYFSQFGENVFTDKEKAEKRLKELQSK